MSCWRRRWGRGGAGRGGAGRGGAGRAAATFSVDPATGEHRFPQPLGYVVPLPQTLEMGPNNSLTINTTDQICVPGAAAQQCKISDCSKLDPVPAGACLRVDGRHTQVVQALAHQVPLKWPAQMVAQVGQKRGQQHQQGSGQQQEDSDGEGAVGEEDNAAASSSSDAMAKPPLGNKAKVYAMSWIADCLRAGLAGRRRRGREQPVLAWPVRTHVHLTHARGPALMPRR